MPSPGSRAATPIRGITSSAPWRSPPPDCWNRRGPPSTGAGAPSAPMAPGPSNFGRGSSKTPTATATSVPTSAPACGTTYWSPATRSFAAEMWPVVHKAIDFVIDMQVGYGEIGWARSEAGVLPEALLTGCSSIFHSIRCALALAAVVGDPQPEWELALGPPGARHLRASRGVHRKGPLLDGLVLPHPRQRLAWSRGGRAHQAALGRLRGRRSGHSLCRRSSVGDRRRNVRAGDGSRRHRAALSCPSSVRRDAASPRRRRIILDGAGFRGREAVARRADQPGRARR